MFCEQCGTELEEDAIFCFNCGAKVASDSPSYDDDDKTVILQEENDFREETEFQEEGQPAVRSDAVETGNLTAEKAGEEGVTGKTTVEAEASAEVGAEMTPEAEASAEVGAEMIPEAEASAEVEAEMTAEAGAAGGGPETVETVEISPTGVVETGTAMMVPEAAAQKKFCPNCGAANGMNDLFCQQCGMFFGNTAEKMGGADAAGKKHKKGFSWKTAAIAAALLVVIGLGIVFVPRILGGMTSKGDDLDFIMYVKDNELTMARKNKYEPMVVGDRVFDDKDVNGVGSAYNLVKYSPDRKYVFYPQKIDDGGCELYRKKLGSKKAEAEKIDSDVQSYSIIDNDTLVYVKDNADRKLYLYRKGESEKIASNAWYMRVSADGKYIMWRDDDNRLYVQDTDLKSDKMKLDSDVYQIYAVSDDFGKIVYQKEDKLYVMKGMEEKEKIASDVYEAYTYDINGSLELYYLKAGDQTNLSYYDLIDDDCLVQDQQMAEPRIEDYQKVTYKDSFWGKQKSVEVDDSYYEEQEKYQQKQDRDYLRSSLESSLLGMEECEIYYYQDTAGESNKVMTVLQKQGENAYGSAAADTALMYVYNIDMEKIEKSKLSGFIQDGYIDYYEVQQKVEKRLGEGRQLLYIENGELHEIGDYEPDDEYSPYLNAWANEEKQILYISEFGNEENKLYSLAYGRKDASLELITDELAQMVSWGMDEICYINEDDELYYADTLIAEEVGAWIVWENEAILYLTDMDKDRKEGTLHLYQNGKDTEIADDVSNAGGYGMFDSDKVVFLTDYNFKKFRGDLNVFNGKKVQNIDSDVTGIIF